MMGYAGMYIDTKWSHIGMKYGSCELTACATSCLDDLPRFLLDIVKPAYSANRDQHNTTC